MRLAPPAHTPGCQLRNGTQGRGIRHVVKPVCPQADDDQGPQRQAWLIQGCYCRQADRVLHRVPQALLVPCHQRVGAAIQHEDGIHAVFAHQLGVQAARGQRWQGDSSQRHTQNAPTALSLKAHALASKP